MSEKSCKEYFGERLKLLRNSEGLSQQELAEKLGVSKGSLGFYETCRNTPDIEFLDRTAKYFGVSVDYLLGRSEVQQEEKTDVKDICDYLGLSDKSLESILELKCERENIEIFNTFLESSFIQWMISIIRLIRISKKTILLHTKTVLKGKTPKNVSKTAVVYNKLAVADYRNKLSEMMLKLVDTITSYSYIDEELNREFINSPEYKSFVKKLKKAPSINTPKVKFLGGLDFTEEDYEVLTQLLFEDKKDGDQNG